MGPHGTYTLFKKDGDEVAGMMSPAEGYTESKAPFWACYVEVDDVDAYAAKVETCGGKVIAPPDEVPNVGRTCMISDPEGTLVCLITTTTRRDE